MRTFYYESEFRYFQGVHSLSGFLPQTLIKVLLATVFFAGFAFLPPLIMLRRVFLDRRIRFLIVCVLVLMAGMVIQNFLLAHYLAPFTAVFYAIGLQAMRHLRLWRPEGKPVGLAMVRLTVTLCFLMAGMRLYAGPLHLALPEWPVGSWNFSWYGPDHFGTERARVENILDKLPGKQLVLVRYTSRHNPLDEWVYNAADIDDSKVVWARDMKPADNQELLDYYRGRKVWLVEPDSIPAVVTPFPVPEQPAAVAH